MKKSEDKSEPAIDAAKQSVEEFPAVMSVCREHYVKLASMAALAQELQDKVLRLAADMENLKKRSARERDEARRFANEGFAEDIVSAMDSFDLGIQAAETATEPQAIAEGMRMALMQLTGVLKNHGLTPIDAEGAVFDPNLHEALGQEPASDSVPENCVLKQLRRGWKYHDRLLRPASVIVAAARDVISPASN